MDTNNSCGIGNTDLETLKNYIKNLDYTDMTRQGIIDCIMDEIDVMGSQASNALDDMSKTKCINHCGADFKVEYNHAMNIIKISSKTACVSEMLDIFNDLTML